MLFVEEQRVWLGKIFFKRSVDHKFKRDFVIFRVMWCALCPAPFLTFGYFVSGRRYVRPQISLIGELDIFHLAYHFWWWCVGANCRHYRELHMGSLGLWVSEVASQIG